jgi:hypothetical protein
LLVQGATDTIFFRPEVQLIGLFCLASLAQPLPNEQPLPGEQTPQNDLTPQNDPTPC